MKTCNLVTFKLALFTSRHQGFSRLNYKRATIMINMSLKHNWTSVIIGKVPLYFFVLRGCPFKTKNEVKLLSNR